MKELKSQCYVKFSGKEQGNLLINFLVSNGFENIQSIKAESLRIPVIVINKNKTFFTTNVTCMACAVSCGKQIFSVEEFLRTFNKKQEYRENQLQK